MKELKNKRGGIFIFKIFNLLENLLVLIVGILSIVLEFILHIIEKFLLKFIRMAFDYIISLVKNVPKSNHISVDFILKEHQLVILFFSCILIFLFIDYCNKVYKKYK